MHKILRAKSQEPGASPDLSRPARAPALSTSAACLLSRQPLLVLLAAFLLLTSGNAYAQDSVESDRAALVALYNATAGANWTNNTNWLSSEALSEWHGVETDEDGRVTALYLSDNELSGKIPAAELGDLTNLQGLFLSRNMLDGEIPAELGDLASLQRLYLAQSMLDGEIPAELGDLTNLQELGLSNNALSGEIPAELGDLASLQWLYLSWNMLDGEIPTELGDLTSLQGLFLHGNELSGEIPTELGDLTSLQWLRLSRNMLDGEIPTELGDLTSLQWLRLSRNMLDGEIPAELGNLTNLQELNLSANELSGEIPAELGDLTSLQGLFLHGNELSGEIPAELGDLASLQRLFLDGNELSGEIPAELGDLASLQELNLGANELSGEIPAELGDLASLQRLFLQGNELSGEIPPELGNLTQLQTLFLNTNQLTGEIPAELAQLTQLRGLFLNTNQLTGEIPAELGDLASLQWLDLGANELSGEIPAELAQLTQLLGLILHGNQLTGPIPSWLVNLAELRELSLWSNELTGTIPPEVAPAQDRAALRVFFIATGGANWTDNTNWFRAELLSEWYGVTTDAHGRVTGLSLSANGLTGTIGPELGVLTRLTELHLNGNQLTGTIPVEFGNLTELQVFDIRNTGLCVTADSELHTWIATIQDFQGMANCQLTLGFAHFANGAGMTSDLVFVNVAPQPVRPAIYFYDTEGNPIAAESVVDITSDLAIQEDGGLTVLTEMEPLGELTVSTHGRGDLVSGSVRVVSEGPIGGMLRYDLPGIGEAVVGASPPVSDVLFAVRRQEGGITTGVAVHNLEEEAMEVVCELMREGVLLDAVSLPLEANGQTSWMIDAAFPAADTSDFAGSVRCAAVGEGRFGAVALEMDPGSRIFITLPVFPVNRLAGGRAAVLDFAHFVNGDGTTSDLVFVNVSTQPSRPAVYFYDTEGNPIAAESVVDLTGDLVIQEDGSLTVQTQMEPLGVLTISTHGQGPLVSGSVRVVSDGPIGGLLRYDLPHVGEAVVGASPPLGDALFPVRRREGGITTGVALHNLESSPGLVRCDLLREGVLRDSASIPLEANGQTSWLIDQAFPAADTSDFAGSVRCDAVGQGLFSAVALEMDPGTRIFTTLPVTEMPSQE